MFQEKCKEICVLAKVMCLKRENKWLLKPTSLRGNEMETFRHDVSSKRNQCLEKEGQERERDEGRNIMHHKH